MPWMMPSKNRETENRELKMSVAAIFHSRFSVSRFPGFFHPIIGRAESLRATGVCTVARVFQDYVALSAASRAADNT